MAGDDDLASLLPDPPPPRPDRREAAIGAALRRFDGVDEPRSAAQRPAAAPRPAWTRPSRGQLGAFASIALVAVIGLPLALVSIGQLVPPADRQAPPPPSTDVARAPATPDRAPAANPPKAAVPAAPTPAAATEAAHPVSTSPAAVRPAAEPPVVEAYAESAPAPPPPSPPPPPPPPPPEPAPAPPAMLAQKSQAPQPELSGRSTDVVVSARRRVAAAEQSVPVAVVSEAADEGIVVTGMRAGGAARAGRGDWNACTVNDPNADLARCRHLVDPGAKGERGRAAAHVADGLARAWRGDDGGAIAAFDQAIALDRRFAFAWLNRGLAHQRRGELDRAIADLDQAVRYAPGAARGYYNRAQLHRARGDERRAAADETRAVRLDPRYRILVE